MIVINFTMTKVKSANLLANVGLLLGGLVLANFDKVMMIKKEVLKMMMMMMMMMKMIH